MDSKSCVFCDIGGRRIPASFVFEDDLVIAFMSLEQPTPCKVLVATRTHVRDLFDLTSEQAAAVFRTTVAVAHAVKAVSGCEGLNLVQSNGASGQQDVLHFHLHVVARWPGDSIRLFWPQDKADRSELDSSAAAIAAEIDRIGTS